MPSISETKFSFQSKIMYFPAALYRSFDNSNGLTMMEGTIQVNFSPLVSGKVR